MVAEHPSAHYGRTAVAEPAAAPAAVRRMSWGAALAGAAIALGLQLLLSLLGVGIGLSTVDPAAGDTPGATTFGVATGIYYAIVTLLSLFVGGWVAGHLAGIPRRIDGLLHGLVTWSVAILLLLYVVTTTVGAVVSGTLGALSSTLQAAGQSVQAAAGALADSEIGSDALSAIEQQARQLLGQGQQGAGGQDAGGLLQQVMAVAEGGVSDQERQRLVDQLVQQTGITREEAEAQLQQLESQYQDALVAAEQQAQQAAQATAEAVAQGSFWSFVALLLGAAAAALGGWMGAPRDLPAAPVRRSAVGP
jgi:hypothetical protein